MRYDTKEELNVNSKAVCSA